MALIFGLKEGWELAFDTRAKIPREKVILFNEIGFKEEDEYIQEEIELWDPK